MPDFELKAVITITGYENITAATRADALKILEDRIEAGFTFKVPLSNKSSVVDVYPDPDGEDK